MKTVVQWEPYLKGVPNFIDREQIDILERQWGVILPESYKQVVSRYQGMSPEPGVFNVDQGDDVFCVLLTIEPYEGKETYSVQKVHQVLKPHVPAGIFPFAKTPGGEHLCFDYRASTNQPKIVLVTVETWIFPVAESFEALLDGLYQ